MKTYTIREFRANMREAMNLVEAGEMVVINRHGVDFVLTTASHWNDKQVQAQKGFATLVTDDKSSDIRPEIAPSPEKIASEPQAAEDFPREAKGQRQEIKEALCCSYSKPCRHWYFNAEMQEWKNILSGRVKQTE